MAEMYERSISHNDLGKFRIVRARTWVELEAKLSELQNTWDDQWKRKLEAQSRKDERDLAAFDKQGKIELAAQKTAEAEAAISELEGVLQATFTNRYPDLWESMLDRRSFSKPRPAAPEKRVTPTLLPPQKPDPSVVPPRPDREDYRFRPRIGLLDSIIPGWKQKRIDEAKRRFEQELASWKESARAYNAEVERYNAERKRLQEEQTRAESAAKKLYRERLDRYDVNVALWEAEKIEFEAAQEERKRAYYTQDPDAVMEYCEAVLARSKYPEYCPQNFNLQYIPETKRLIVDYYLPSMDCIPGVKGYRYNQSKDQIVPTMISESARNKLYEDSTYRIALRTLHELFATDDAKAVDSIAYNGIVNTIDPATGRKVSPCILSVQVSREQFQDIELTHVEPKACFKKLKGVSAARLHTLTPVAPVAQISRDDRRFVDAYEVASGLDDSVNLAAMDWEDFEHLIRELFQKVFSSDGAEVRVTQASRDGGVDAVVIDPDPIKGGKIVIQAKRYTNVVGVSAVRDLWGTVQHEGASKGILVTTSHYGADAYEFAKGKPLVLLEGGNLLSLLEKHGNRAKIDIPEARKLMGKRPGGN